MKHFLLVLLCFLLMLFSPNITAQISADPSDSTTLLEFQRKLIKGGWPALWDTNQWIMNWEGVTLNYSSGKVEALTIHGDKLTRPFKTDSLAPAIVHLTLLDSLKDLSFTSLGLKHVPKEIGLFENLEYLGLHYNELSAVPDEISRLTKLRDLNLTSNNLVSLPDLSGLTNLENLSLTSNSTLIQFPPTVSTLYNLRRLYIHYTSIVQLPEGIKNLTNLRILNATSADLTSLPASMGEMSSLTTLELGNNEITALPPSIGDLNRLKEIDVSGNNLTVFPPMLTSMHNLRYILAGNNEMEGQVPPGLFNIPNLTLYLNGNNLSGPLPIKDGNIPSKLYIKGNRFTFKAIIDHYDDFGEGDLGFHPQQEIGTRRTYEPVADKAFSLYIDGYNPLPGCVFQWYGMKTIFGEPIALSSREDTLQFPSFDPGTDGGIYYCVITHPSLPGLSLRSRKVRVIGENDPPSLSARDVVFRHGTVGMLQVSARDDYTPGSELPFGFPSGTKHFNLVDDGLFPNRRAVHPKNSEWTGTDTVTVAVSDEQGNSSSVQVTLTVLPVENEPPSIDIPPIYMSNYQDYTPPCVPGTPGCVAKYVWESMTYLTHFIKDDFTAVKDLEYKILEADGGVIIPNRVFCSINKWPHGTAMGVNVLALKDSTITVTLRVTDTEGGVSEQRVTLIGNSVRPNQHPIISGMPDQVILKGVKEFPRLNLNAHATDDYVSSDLFFWENSSVPSLHITLSDSVATVRPAYSDSSYAASVAYFVSEKTNYNRRSQVEVTYRIIDGVIVSGTVKDAKGQALSGVDLQGFPVRVSTDIRGTYEANVLPGWGGKVWPVLEDYRFTPDTVGYSNLQASLNGQNFTGTYIGDYTISGTVVTASGEPVPGVRLLGLPGNILTDENGAYSTEVPYDWEGQVTPALSGHGFEPPFRGYAGMSGNLQGEDYAAARVVTGLAPGLEGQVSLKAYPSPTARAVNFRVRGLAGKGGRLVIYDVLGRPCKAIALAPGVPDYSWSPRGGGVYHAKLFAGRELSAVVKFIVLR